MIQGKAVREQILRHWPTVTDSTNALFRCSSQANGVVHSVSRPILFDIGQSTELFCGMAQVRTKKPDARKALLDAAKKVLRRDGYAGLSTREVAESARVPLSQIHYHFGSKTGLVLALFEHQNNELLARQRTMFDDTSMPLSARWDRACDYLDEDIASGYVRTYQELIAASWSDPDIAKAIQPAQFGWHALLTEVAGRISHELGGLGPFTPKELASLVGNAFIGAESMFLCGMEKQGFPVRDCLRRVGDLIRILEQQKK